MLKPFFRPETGIFLVLWLGLMLVGRTQLFRDPGTYWHTVVGERILATGHLPEVDDFSFTHAGKPWIAYHWLGEVGMAAIHRLLGFDGLLLALATALAALYTWTAHRLIRAGFHWSMAAILIALTLAASAHNWHVRPHMVTLIALGITFGLLLDVEGRRRSLWSLLWLPPLFLIWVNCHGGVLGGLATLGIIAMGWLIWWVPGWDSPIKRPWQVLFAGGIVVVCILTVFVNPYGLETPRFWRTIMSLDLPRVIQEHAPLNPLEISGMAILGFGLVYLLVLIGVLPRWPRLSWLVPLLWLSQAWSRNRHGPLFAVTAVLAIAEIMPHTRWAKYLIDKGSDLFRPNPQPVALGWKPLVLPALLVLMTLALQLAGVSIPIVGRGWVQENAAYWPVELLPRLQDIEKKAEQPVPIFNDLLYGGFLIYHTPKLRVFVDDRCELYGNEFLLAYDEAERSRPEKVDDWAQIWQFQYVLTRSGSLFDQYLGKSERWRLVEETPTAVLYQRANTSPQPQQGP